MTTPGTWQLRATEAFAGTPWLETERELWLYRGRTMTMLKRYGRASVEVGRLPSLLGRECFRARVKSYSKQSFEDIVIFVHDMERALERLSALQRQMIAMNVLEEYTWQEMARLLGCCERTIGRGVADALDALTDELLTVGLIDEGGELPARPKGCQEGRNGVFELNDTNESKNIF